jgi:hypothetical protein
MPAFSLQPSIPSPPLPLLSFYSSRHPTSRKNELPGISQWMLEQQHKRIYAEDILRLSAEARKTTLDKGEEPHLMPVAL